MTDIYVILKILIVFQILMLVGGVIVYFLFGRYIKVQKLTQERISLYLTTSPPLINTQKLALIVLPLSLGLLIYVLGHYENVKPDLLIINAVLLYINTIVLLVTRIWLYKQIKVKIDNP